MYKLLLLAFFLFSNWSYSQEITEYDLVIVIDEDIVIAPEKLLIKFGGSDNSLSFIPTYHPGSLILTKEQNDKLFSEQNESFKIVFSYSSKSKHYFYEIEFLKEWLKYPFTILRIYNLDKTKYQKKYAPVQKDANYSKSLDFGHYQIIKLKD